MAVTKDDGSVVYEIARKKTVVLNTNSGVQISSKRLKWAILLLNCHPIAGR